MFLWILLLWVLATHHEWFQSRLNEYIVFLRLDDDDVEEEEGDDTLPTTHIPFVKEKPLNDMETYCQSKHDHWMRIFPEFNIPHSEISEVSSDENIEPILSTLLCRWNSNIDPLFYDRTQLKEVWEDPKNDIEAQWRRRVLYESTPRGNVMMHYDAYREGYVYYSDQTSIPYCILNAVAMKYVLMFKCRDLFVDQTLYAHNPSPMIRSMREEDDKEQDKKTQSMHQLLHGKTDNTNTTSFAVSDASPFVKFRSKQHDTSTPVSSNAKTTASATVPAARCTVPVHMTPDALPAIKNKFIYMGKFHNWTPLQSMKKTRSIPTTSTPTQFDGLFAKADLAQRSVLDYKTYKLMKTPNTTT